MPFLKQSRYSSLFQPIKDYKDIKVKKKNLNFAPRRYQKQCCHSPESVLPVLPDAHCSVKQLNGPSNNANNNSNNNNSLSSLIDYI